MFIQQSINRAWCLATFELVRLFFTKRGLLALAAFATPQCGLLFCVTQLIRR